MAADRKMMTWGLILALLPVVAALSTLDDASILTDVAVDERSSTWVPLLLNAAYSGKTNTSYPSLATGAFTQLLVVYKSGQITPHGCDGKSAYKYNTCNPDTDSTAFAFELMLEGGYILEMPDSRTLPRQCLTPLTPAGDILCDVNFSVLKGTALIPTWYDVSHAVNSLDGNRADMIYVDIYARDFTGPGTAPYVIGIVPRYPDLSLFGGQVLTIVGSNFGYDPKAVSVAIGSQKCESVQMAAADRKLTCITPAMENNRYAHVTIYAGDRVGQCENCFVYSAGTCYNQYDLNKKYRYEFEMDLQSSSQNKREGIVQTTANTMRLKLDVDLTPVATETQFNSKAALYVHMAVTGGSLQMTDRRAFDTPACGVGAPAGVESGSANLYYSNNANSGAGRLGGSPWTCLGTSCYIYVNLDRASTIFGIASQGSQLANEYVTSYTVKYWTGSAWQWYNEDPRVTTSGTIIAANTDQNTLVTHKFKVPFKAQWILILPHSYVGKMAMRLEVYACAGAESDHLAQAKVTKCRTVGGSSQSGQECQNSFIPGSPTGSWWNLANPLPSTTTVEFNGLYTISRLVIENAEQVGLKKVKLAFTDGTTQVLVLNKKAWVHQIYPIIPTTTSSIEFTPLETDSSASLSLGQITFEGYDHEVFKTARQEASALIQQLSVPFYFRQTCLMNVNMVYHPSGVTSKVSNLLRGIASSFTSRLAAEQVSAGSSLVYDVQEETAEGMQSMTYTHSRTSDCEHQLSKQSASADADKEGFYTVSKGDYCYQSGVLKNAKNSGLRGYESASLDSGTATEPSAVSEGTDLLGVAVTRLDHTVVSEAEEELLLDVQTFESTDHFHGHLQDHHGRKFVSSSLKFVQDDTVRVPGGIPKDRVLHAIAGLSESKSARHTAYKRLQRFLQYDEQVEYEIALYLEKHKGVSAGVQADLCNLLAVHGTASAQKALISHLSHPEATETSKTVVQNSLSLVQLPTKHTVASLVDLSSQRSDIGTQTFPLLGEYASKLGRAGHLSAQDELLGHLHTRLTSALARNDTWTLQQLALAHQSAGHHSSYDSLVAMTHHRHAMVRDAAASAIASMFGNHSHTMDVVMRHFAREAHATVRASIVRAFTKRSPVPERDVVRMLDVVEGGRERDPQVVKALFDFFVVNAEAGSNAAFSALERLLVKHTADHASESEATESDIDIDDLDVSESESAEYCQTHMGMVCGGPTRGTCIHDECVCKMHETYGYMGSNCGFKCFVDEYEFCGGEGHCEVSPSDRCTGSSDCNRPCIMDQHVEKEEEARPTTGCRFLTPASTRAQCEKDVEEGKPYKAGDDKEAEVLQKYRACDGAQVPYDKKQKCLADARAFEDDLEAKSNKAAEAAEDAQRCPNAVTQADKLSCRAENYAADVKKKWSDRLEAIKEETKETLKSCKDRPAGYCGKGVLITRGPACWCKCKAGWTGPTCSDRDDCTATDKAARVPGCAGQKTGKFQKASLKDVAREILNNWNMGSYHDEVPDPKDPHHKNFKGFDKRFGSEDVYAGLAMAGDANYESNDRSLYMNFFAGFSTYLRLWAIRRPIIEAYAKLSVIFDPDVCADEDQQSTNADNNRARAGVKYDVLGMFVKQYGIDIPLCSPGDPCLPEPVSLPFGDVTLGTITLFEISRTVLLGVIPIKFSVTSDAVLSVQFDFRLIRGLKGEMQRHMVQEEGTTQAVGVMSQLRGMLKPRTEVTITGDINIDIVVANAGIALEITLLDVGVPIVIGYGLQSKKACIGVSMEIEALGGRGFIYADIGPCPLCYSTEYVLFEWQGLETSLQLGSTSCCNDCAPTSCYFGVCHPATGKCACDLIKGRAAYFGASCNMECPGMSADGPCHGHGTCSAKPGPAGKDPVPLCTCDTGYYGFYCTHTCPGGPFRECLGHGRCDEETLTCICSDAYKGDKCELLCPGGPYSVCSGHGNCIVPHTNTTACDCHHGYKGVYCEKKCPVGPDDSVCSGNGECHLHNGQTKCNCRLGFAGDACDEFAHGAGYALSHTAFKAITSSCSFPAQDEITISVYVKVDSSYIYSSFVLRTGTPGFYAYIVSTDWHVSVRFPDDQWARSVQAIRKDEWTHLSFIYSKSRDVRRILVHSASSSASLLDQDIEVPLAAEELDAHKDMEIATSLLEATEWAVGGFQGLIDELQIWNTALSAAEVGVYVNTLASPSTPNLVHYYHFDESAGNYLYDEMQKCDLPLPEGSHFVTSSAPIYEVSHEITFTRSTASAAAAAAATTADVDDTAASSAPSSSSLFGGATAAEGEAITDLATSLLSASAAASSGEDIEGDREAVTPDAVQQLSAAIASVYLQSDEVAPASFNKLDSEVKGLESSPAPPAPPPAPSGQPSAARSVSLTSVRYEVDIMHVSAAFLSVKLYDLKPSDKSAECIAVSLNSRALNVPEKFVLQNLRRDPEGGSTSYYYHYQLAPMEISTILGGVGSLMAVLKVEVGCENVANKFNVLRAHIEVIRRAVNSYARFPTVGEYLYSNRIPAALDSQVTLEAWVWASKGDQGTVVWLGDTAMLKADGSFHVRTQQGTLIARAAPSTLVFYDGTFGAVKWAHYTGTYDGMMARVFINGQEQPPVASAKHSSFGAYPLPAIPSRAVYVGVDFGGQIDDVRVWSVTRGAVKDRILMFATEEGDSEGLLAWWTFDERGATSILDSVGKYPLLKMGPKAVSIETDVLRAKAVWNDCPRRVDQYYNPPCGNQFGTKAVGKCNTKTKQCTCDATVGLNSGGRNPYCVYCPGYENHLYGCGGKSYGVCSLAPISGTIRKAQCSCLNGRLGETCTKYCSPACVQGKCAEFGSSVQCVCNYPYTGSNCGTTCSSCDTSSSYCAWFSRSDGTLTSPISYSQPWGGKHAATSYISGCMCYPPFLNAGSPSYRCRGTLVKATATGLETAGVLPTTPSTIGYIGTYPDTKFKPLAQVLEYKKPSVYSEIKYAAALVTPNQYFSKFSFCHSGIYEARHSNTYSYANLGDSVGTPNLGKTYVINKKCLLVKNGFSPVSTYRLCAYPVSFAFMLTTAFGEAFRGSLSTVDSNPHYVLNPQCLYSSSPSEEMEEETDLSTLDLNELVKEPGVTERTVALADDLLEVDEALPATVGPKLTAASSDASSLLSLSLTKAVRETLNKSTLVEPTVTASVDIDEVDELSLEVLGSDASEILL